MTVTFSGNGLPLLLDFHGELPENTLKVKWKWSSEPQKRLERLSRSVSYDFGKTYHLASEIVVLQFERGLANDNGLLDSP